MEMLGRCAGTGIGRTGTLRLVHPLPIPKGPDMSNPSVFAKVDKDNWLVRTVRGGSGNTDKSRMRISYRKDFNKTWYQYAITVRPVVPAPSDPRAVVIVNVLPAHLGSATGSGIYEVDSTAKAGCKTHFFQIKIH